MFSPSYFLWKIILTAEALFQHFQAYRPVKNEAIKNSKRLMLIRFTYMKVFWQKKGSQPFITISTKVEKKPIKWRLIAPIWKSLIGYRLKKATQIFLESKMLYFTGQDYLEQSLKNCFVCRTSFCSSPFFHTEYIYREMRVQY